MWYTFHPTITAFGRMLCYAMLSHFSHVRLYATPHLRARHCHQMNLPQTRQLPQCGWATVVRPSLAGSDPSQPRALLLPLTGAWCGRHWPQGQACLLSPLGVCTRSAFPLGRGVCCGPPYSRPSPDFGFQHILCPLGLWGSSLKVLWGAPRTFFWENRVLPTCTQQCAEKEPASFLYSERITTSKFIWKCI